MQRSLKPILLLLLSCSLVHVNAQQRTALTADTALLRIVDTALGGSVEQYKLLMKQLPDHRLPRSFEKGHVQTVTPYAWTSGFYLGSLLYLYEYSADTALLNEINRRLPEQEQLKTVTANHDLGFMMNCSFGNALRLLKKPEYRDILVRSAQSLSTRFYPKVGCIKSWDSVRSLDGRRMLRFPVIIDNMMNLELLFLASKITNDPLYRNIAVRHATTTLKNHFRPDFSSYHVVNYDSATGAVLSRETQQGFSDNSTWARGQAWAIYGFTMVYRETKDSKFLNAAEKMADFYIDHPNLPSDKIPYWDFNVRGRAVPRDASAAAIVSSALLELSAYAQPNKGVKYLHAAESMLRSLSSSRYRAAIGTHGGFILMHSCGGVPGNVEVDVPLSYADYYYLEALMRYRRLALRPRISLTGAWQFKADSSGRGLQDNWQDSTFKESVRLPGTMAENKKGHRPKQPSTDHLTPLFEYTGAAWYQREIILPPSWQGQEVKLYLERTKVTRVWIDGKPVGTSTLLSAHQVYALGDNLRTGRHALTIMVDNDPALVSVGGSHALSEHTQTNWNGIVGAIYLERTDRTRINWIKIDPDFRQRSAAVTVSLSAENTAGRTLQLELEAAAWNCHKAPAVSPLARTLTMTNTDTVLRIMFPLGKNARLWSEHNPAMYRLTARLRDSQHIYDMATADFGLREFKTRGTQFTINGLTTFLRGKNDACVFPLTGYPPTDTAAWRHLFRIAKSYGINHYRFHSYTPPEAAFLAADAEGIYIQAELPNWANFSVNDTAHTDFQLKEGKAILDAYGNHPSFVMLSLGNEIGGDTIIADSLVRVFKRYDDRRLYAHGTNAFYADPRPGQADDFWTTMRTGKESEQRQYDVRSSFATTEDTGSGLLNSLPPGTRHTYSTAIAHQKLPVIGHEIGQFQVYPDYREIIKYTGVLKASNLAIFRQRLEKAGMGDEADTFFKASGKLAALLYRAEIGSALRTPGLAGFELLDLQDFPGQGTALVGLLNAFMESKGIITSKEFRSFNNDVVIQLLMDKYTWTTDETYQADIQLVNYSGQNIKDRTLWWKVTDTRNGTIASGHLPVLDGESGRIDPLGKISFSLGSIHKAAKLRIVLEIPGSNVIPVTYPVWVYPPKGNITIKKHIKICSALGEDVFQALDSGRSVLLFPDHAAIKDRSLAPQFISEFWNWKVFKDAAIKQHRPVSAGTLGIVTNPKHPLFNNFPTAFHTGWQWWSILKHTRPLILDKTDSAYRPIVQAIDNIDRNHKLGIIFEFSVGKGRLLICMADLPAILDKPEARQLYQGMLDYMASENFKPKTSITPSLLKELL